MLAMIGFCTRVPQRGLFGGLDEFPLLLAAHRAKGCHSIGRLPPSIVARCGGRFGVLRNVNKVAEGTIKRLTDKGFGFIDTGKDKDIFFHMSAVEGTTFDQLQEGDRVSFESGQGPKGPRAESVRVI